MHLKKISWFKNHNKLVFSRLLSPLIPVCVSELMIFGGIQYKKENFFFLMHHVSFWILFLYLLLQYMFA